MMRSSAEEFRTVENSSAFSDNLAEFPSHFPRTLCTASKKAQISIEPDTLPN